MSGFCEVPFDFISPHSYFDRVYQHGTSWFNNIFPPFIVKILQISQIVRAFPMPSLLQVTHRFLAGFTSVLCLATLRHGLDMLKYERLSHAESDQYSSDVSVASIMLLWVLWQPFRKVFVFCSFWSLWCSFFSTC